MYCFDRGNYEGMRDKLENSNWRNEYLKTNGKTTVEDKWLSLKSMLVAVRETFVPKHTMTDKPSWRDKGSFTMNAHARQ